MDVKLFFIELILTFVLFQGKNVNCELDVYSASFNNTGATGSEYGLSVEIDYSGSDEITCLVDASDADEVDFLNSPTSPFDLQTSLSTYGFKDIYLLVFGLHGFHEVVKENFYIGVAITEIDVSNNASDFAIPFSEPLSNDIDFEVSFLTGTDVNITVTLEHNNKSYSINSVSNGTHAFNFSKDNFQTSGLYTVNVVLANPLAESGISRYAILAVQEPVDGVKLKFAQYEYQVVSNNDMNYLLMVGQGFNLEVLTTSGEDLTISVLAEQENNMINMTGITCVGKVATKFVTLSFSSTGSYNLTISISNYVSYHNETLTVDVVHAVNSISIDVSPLLLLLSSEVDFVATVADTALLPMGDVNCTVIFGDNAANMSLDFDMWPTNYTSLGSTSVTATKTYTAEGWYSTQVNCSNSLPGIINSVETFVSRSTIVNVYNPVETLTLIHDSPDHTHHPFTTPVTFTVKLTDPNGDPPNTNLTCVFDFDQGGEGDLLPLGGDVTSSSSITYAKHFSRSNEYNVSVNCSNLMSHQVLTAADTFTIYYNCWSPEYYFDSAYQLPNGALSSKTNEEMRITPKIGLTGNCNGTVQHYWTLYNVSNNVDTVYRNMTSLSATLLNIAKYELPEALFKLKLSVYYPDSSPLILLSDFIYIDYTYPSLQPSIMVDGSINSFKSVFIKKQVVFDTTLTSDPSDPNKTTESLTRTWACRTGADLNESIINDYLSNNDFSTWPSGAVDVCADLFKEGAVKFTIPIDSLTADRNYIFKLTVDDRPTSRTTTIVQAIAAANMRSLDAKLVCVTNCNKVTDSNYILAFVDLMMNVAVNNTEIRNNTMRYKWSLEVKQTDASSFVNQTSYITETTMVGFTLPQKLIETLGGVQYRVTCVISVSDFAPTSVSQTFTLNLPPYNGTCVWDPVPGAVTASITQVCFTCSNWKDEENRGIRGSEDKGGTLQYSAEQLFLTETNEVNTSIPTSLQSFTVNTRQCLKLLKSPIESVNKTRVRVKVRDQYKEPQVEFNLSDLEIQPAVSNTASGEAGVQQIENLLSNTLADLTSATKLNSLEDTSNSIKTIANALPDNSPVEEQPITADEDDGGFIISEDENGEPMSADSVLDSFAKKPADQTNVKCQEVMKSLTDTLLTTSSSQSKEVKTDIGSQLNVVYAVNQIASKKRHLNDDSLGLVNDIFGGILGDTKQVDNKNPEYDRLIKDCLDMSGKVGAALMPDRIGGVEADVSLEAERRRTQNLALFASKDTIQEFEDGKLGEDEMNFFKTLNAQRQKVSVFQRQSVCNKFSKQKSEYQKNVVHNILVSDGAVKRIDSVDSKAAITKDTSEFLANKTLNGSTASVKMPNELVNKKQQRISVALFEVSTVTHIDESGAAGAITSGEKTLVIDTEGEIPGTVTVAQRVPPVEKQTVEKITNEEDASGCTYFQTLVKHEGDDLNINLEPDPDSSLSIEKFEVYILYVENPDNIDTEFVSKVKFTSMKESTESNNWVARFSPADRGQVTGVYKVCAHPVITEDNSTSSRLTRSVTLNKNETFKFATATMACMTWDDATDSWRSDECTGAWKPDTGELECDCKPKKELTFANSFYVAPNKIDFNSVFLKFSPLNQAAVMAVLILIFVIYIIIVIWTRRQDRKDLLKWGITPLSDNFSEDNYFYVIKVFTGMRPGAGTKSRICMVISGEEMDTGVRELYDGVRDEFSTGSVMIFLMSTTVYLGDLDYIRIWHDNSGEGNYASWYLSRMEVHDVQRNESFSFLGERWLAVEKDDGLLECVLPVCKSENLNVFKNRLFMNAKDNLADSHIWVSVAYRPQVSNFTRTQRASCALLFVMLTMIANAMFFKGSDEGNYETPAELQVGPFRFSLKQIYISVICALVVTPGTLLVIYLFKLARVRIDPDATLFKPNDKSSRYRIPFMNNWLENEQKRSIELEKHLVQKGLPSQQGFALPHWCRNIAWFIVLATCFICAFFIMLYSMEWGKQKSEEWITTFLLSFFESVFCLDPVKVGIMALVLAILFRSAKDSESPVNRSTIMKKYSSSLRGKSKGIRLPAPPLDHRKLEKARKEKQRDMLMKRAVRDIIVNVFIIWILFSISFSNRDVRSYYMHTEVVNTLLEPLNMPSFSSIRTTNDFFDWLKNTAIINSFPEFEKDANNTPLHWRVRQFTEGGTHFRVGPPRLRQLRTTKQSCTNSPFATEDCFKKYSEPSEDTEAYCIGWKDGPCHPDEKLYNYSSEAWTFTSAFDIWGMPITGYYTTYGGGGYIAKLSVNRQVSQLILDELYQNSWVDRQTRAVLFEFTLYCLNANIFTYNMFMVEFPETGGAMPFFIVYPMRVYLHQGPLGLYTLACEIIFVLYLIVITILTIIDIVQQKKDFFKKGWQVFDVIFIILAYVAIIMNIVQVIFTDISLDKFRNDKKAFVNFYHLAIWNTFLVLLIGVLVFMATFRTLNILGYNKRIGAVARVFTKAASDLLWFGLFFTYVFTCYSAFGFLLFGWKLKSYKNVFNTMGTLFISMIGKSRFTEIEETDPVFSKVYFMCFIFFVVYMILTMFLAVLSKAIDQVHEDTKKDKSDEMVEYVLKKFKGLMSYGGSSKKGTVKPAPWNRNTSWSRKHGGRLAKVTNREILQEIRESMNDALTMDPREFSTPDVDGHKRQVKFRR